MIYKGRVNRTSAQNNRGFVLGLGGAAITVATLWWTPLLFPFRLLSTTIHELSHAITVMLTGGTVQGFSVAWNGSGAVHATGGWPLFVYSAGYLGSTVFGGVMLLIAKNAQGRRGALRFVATLYSSTRTVGIENSPGMSERAEFWGSPCKPQLRLRLRK